MILQPSGTYQYTDSNERLIHGLEYSFPGDHLNDPVQQTQDIDDTFNSIVSLNLQTSNPRIPIHKVLTDNLNDGFGIEYVPLDQASFIEHQSYVLQSIAGSWADFSGINVQSFVSYVQQFQKTATDLQTSVSSAFGLALTGSEILLILVVLYGFFYLKNQAGL